MNFQDEKKSLLLNTLFLLFCALLTFYPQKALPDSGSQYSSEKASSFPSILFGQAFETGKKVDSTDPSDIDSQISTVALNGSSKVASNKPLKIYGPVKNNESLWNIAEKLRTNETINIAHMAVALFQQNPKAFLNNNLNGLLVGVTLEIPEKKQVSQLSKREVETIFQQHWQSWQNNTVIDIKEDIHSANEQDFFQAEDSVKKPISRGVYDKAGDNAPVTDIPVALTESGTDNPALIDAAQSTEEIVVSELIATSNKTDTKTKTETETETDIQLVESGNNSKFVLLDYFSQIKFQSIFNDIEYNFSKSIKLYWLNFKSKVWNNSEQDSLVSLRARLMLVAFIVFMVVLIYFFRRQEIDFTEIQPYKYQPPNLSFSDEGSRQNKNNEDTDHIAIDNIQDDGSYRENTSNVITETSEKNVTSENAVPNQVNINKFLNPDQLSQQGNRLGLLEKAFEHVTFLTNDPECVQSKVSEESVQDKEPACEGAIACNLLDSVEEIKFVHETTRDSKIDAFLQVTQSQKEPSEKILVDEMLATEFAKIKDHDKIDVFIEEFEQLLRTLAQQAPNLESKSDELENLIQFKLSIHFIKVLSEMMQANYLQHFSQTVIEFLEDLVDGKSRMTGDVASRLSIVIGFYNQYINSVKTEHTLKI